MSQNIVELLDFVGTFDKDAELVKVFSPIDNLQKIKIKHGVKEPFESG
jgi:hypothetical protein